jgi:hypothetical protein
MKCRTGSLLGVLMLALVVGCYAADLTCAPISNSAWPLDFMEETLSFEIRGDTQAADAMYRAELVGELSLLETARREARASEVSFAYPDAETAVASFSRLVGTSGIDAWFPRVVVVSETFTDAVAAYDGKCLAELFREVPEGFRVSEPVHNGALTFLVVEGWTTDQQVGEFSSYDVATLVLYGTEDAAFGSIRRSTMLVGFDVTDDFSFNEMVEFASMRQTGIPRQMKDTYGLY